MVKQSFDIEVGIAAGEARHAEKIARFQVDMAMESEGLVLDYERVSSGVRAVLEDEAKGRYIIAQMGEEVVGCLMITREWSDWNGCWYWWIQSVYVTPEYRKQGVYKAMYLKVKDAAKENNISQVRLYVDKTNLSAQKAYQSLGMHESHYLMFEEELGI